MVQYKPEAVKAFEKMEEKFNETHDDIELTIESPNEAMNNPQDKIYQGRSAGYHWNWWRCELFQFPGSDMLVDISDFDGLKDIKQSYLDIVKIWNLFRKMVLTQSRMWQMQQEFFITKKCSKKMAGRSRQPGMNS